MQCTIHQRRHLEYNSLRHAEPMKVDERVGDVVTTSEVENEPCCRTCYLLLTYLINYSIQQETRPSKTTDSAPPVLPPEQLL